MLEFRRRRPNAIMDRGIQTYPKRAPAQGLVGLALPFDHRLPRGSFKAVDRGI